VDGVVKVADLGMAVTVEDGWRAAGVSASARANDIMKRYFVIFFQSTLDLRRGGLLCNAILKRTSVHSLGHVGSDWTREIH
jgi:hypothetical protein